MRLFLENLFPEFDRGDHDPAKIDNLFPLD